MSGLTRVRFTRVPLVRGAVTRTVQPEGIALAAAPVGAPLVEGAGGRWHQGRRGERRGWRVRQQAVLQGGAYDGRSVSGKVKRLTDKWLS